MFYCFKQMVACELVLLISLQKLVHTRACFTPHTDHIRLVFMQWPWYSYTKLANNLCLNHPVYLPCEENPCENGGTCRKFVLEYTCECPSGHSGSFCENEGMHSGGVTVQWAGDGAVKISIDIMLSLG